MTEQTKRKRTKKPLALPKRPRIEWHYIHEIHGFCPTCRAELQFEPCGTCPGSSGLADPETVCPDCRGSGGRHRCPVRDQHGMFT